MPWRSTYSASSQYTFHKADDLSKALAIFGCEAAIVTPLTIGLRGMGTSQVEIDAVIQKLLAFRAEPVIRTGYETPA